MQFRSQSQSVIQQRSWEWMSKYSIYLDIATKYANILTDKHEKTDKAKISGLF